MSRNNRYKTNTPIGGDNNANKIYEDLNGYYLKFIYNEENILIIAFNIELLDGIKYGIKINKDMIYEMNDTFKEYEYEIEHIIKLFDDAIKENKYQLIQQKNSLELILKIKDRIKGEKNLQFSLSNSKKEDEYLTLLSNEIKKLKRKINEITNNSESKEESVNEDNSLNSSSIYDSSKYQSKISLKKEDTNFNIYDNNSLTQQNTGIFCIKDFNKQFNLNITDNNITILDMSNKKIGDKFFYYLNNIYFNQLEELYLYNNNLFNILEFQKTNLPELKILSLSHNNISDINVLKLLNTPKLKELWLYSNNISNIKVFKKVNFKLLEKLSLNDNKIEDISVLEDSNFKNLKELKLNNNEIKDIKVLAISNFEKLQILSLYSNKIKNIYILEKTTFPELKELNLKNNNISDINVLKNVNYPFLERLILSNNKIEDISVFYKSNFKYLKELWLNDNIIIDINVFDNECFYYNNLELLYLNNNNIDINKNSLTIEILKKYIKDFNI